ncbi:BT4734/BF3469 family protein [Streptodolium elevatio]|uniref:DNA primase n=1 Tax=Streptodolium elevatio TaxID=3157996 RepID=A0ABV3DLF3_9ACTN
MRYSPRKIPLQSAGREVASSTDRSTWSSFAEASTSTRGVGMGFVLDGDGIVCVDLDHCLTGGQLAPWAERIVAAAGATYIEVSPSGTGVHIWGRAELVHGRVVHLPGGGKAEVYPNGRYITVTSRPFGDTPSVLGDLSGLVGELIA